MPEKTSEQKPLNHVTSQFSCLLRASISQHARNRPSNLLCPTGSTSHFLFSNFKCLFTCRVYRRPLMYPIKQCAIVGGGTSGIVMLKTLVDELPRDQGCDTKLGNRPL